MKKKKVKRMLYDIRVKMIDEIEEMRRAPDDDFHKSLELDMETLLYGYRIGMSQATMILLDEINRLFPEVEDED